MIQCDNAQTLSVHSVVVMMTAAVLWVMQEPVQENPILVPDSKLWIHSPYTALCCSDAPSRAGVRRLA